MEPFVHSGIGFHRFQSVLFVLTGWKRFMPVEFDLHPSAKVTILWDKPRGIQIMPLALCAGNLFHLLIERCCADPNGNEWLLHGRIGMLHAC